MMSDYFVWLYALEFLTGSCRSGTSATLAQVPGCLTREDQKRGSSVLSIGMHCCSFRLLRPLDPGQGELSLGHAFLQVLFGIVAGVVPAACGCTW